MRVRARADVYPLASPRLLGGVPRRGVGGRGEVSDQEISMVPACMSPSLGLLRKTFTIPGKSSDTQKQTMC